MEELLQAATPSPGLDRVLAETIGVLDRARHEIFAIAEQTRQEYEEVRRELAAVRLQVAEQIRRVEELTRQDREARARLLEISRRFQEASQEEVRAAYEHAREVQIQLHVAWERERHLRAHRDALERRLQRLAQTLTRAEDLVGRTGLALELLRGNLQELSEQVAGLRLRQAMGYTIIRAQEEERRRVAREIHDGPAQLLANVAFRLEICGRLLQEEPERARAELADLAVAVRQSLQDVRAIIFDLRPMALDDLGLVPALRAFVASFTERTGLRVELHAEGEERRLPSAVEIAAFRLVQEALHNAWKHARATTVRVHVRLAEDALHVTVADDGVGFDAQRALAEPAPSRFGLLTMRERVQLLRGSLRVESAPGRGTVVRAVLPLRPEEERS